MRVWPSIYVALLGLMVLSPTLALSHGGGLDGYGCHHDKKHGGYHCHRGQLAGKSFASQHEMLGVLKALEAKKAAPASPNLPSASIPNAQGEVCVRDRLSGEIKCGDVVAR